MSYIRRLREYLYKPGMWGLSAVVCGSRHATGDMKLVREVAIVLAARGLPIGVGCAKGVDAEVRDTLEGLSYRNYKVFYADWRALGTAAGRERNTRMLRETFRKGTPNLLIAFPGGHGTELCVSIAKEMRKEGYDIAISRAYDEPQISLSR